MANTRLIDMTDAFTPAGIEKLRLEVRKKIKPVLKFEYEGSPAYYKIIRITRDGRVLAEYIKMYKPNELRIKEN